MEEPAEESAEPAEEQPEEAGSDSSIELEKFGYIDVPCTAGDSDGEHSFVKGTCENCDYKCPHNRVETRYSWNFADDKYHTHIDDGYSEFAPLDAEKHLNILRFCHQ